MLVALDLFSNLRSVKSSGYLSECLVYITTVSGLFLVRRTGIVSTLLLAFRTSFVRKKSAKSQEQYANRNIAKTNGELQHLVFLPSAVLNRCALRVLTGALSGS